jgi:hypothetical protein
MQSTLKRPQFNSCSIPQKSTSKFFSEIEHKFLVVSLCRNESKARWHMPVTPAPEGLRQEDLKFEASLGYIVRSRLARAV